MTTRDAYPEASGQPKRALRLRRRIPNGQLVAPTVGDLKEILQTGILHGELTKGRRAEPPRKLVIQRLALADLCVPCAG